MATKRLQREFEEITRHPVDFWEVYPNENDIYYWNAVLTGHPDSSYAGKKFCAELIFTDKYPYEAPQFRFKTKITHRNVGPSGTLCLDILKKNAWSPAYTISTLLLSIGSLIFEKPLILTIQRSSEQ